MELSKLESLLKQAWIQETSADPKNWNSQNPAWGQCAVTALIVNDYCGGDIVWAEVELPNEQKASHYFNLIDGEDTDLTCDQFPKGTNVPQGTERKKGFKTTRDYVLSHLATRNRYELLKKRVELNQ